MDQGLQPCAGLVGDGACEEQIVQHEEIAVDDCSHPGFALRRGVQSVAVEEVIGLEILDLVAVQDRLIGNRLGAWISRCPVCRRAARSRRRQ